MSCSDLRVMLSSTVLYSGLSLRQRRGQIGKVALRCRLRRFDSAFVVKLVSNLNGMAEMPRNVLWLPVVPHLGNC